MFRAISAGLCQQESKSLAQSRARPPCEDELSALCRSQIFPYALRCLGQAQDAEDVAVETLAAALASLHKFRGQTEPRLWLLGIARRKIADAQRRRSRHRTEPIEDAELWALPSNPSHEPEAAALRAEEMSQLRALVLQLPELQREALLLQAVEGLSIGEIARVMNRSESATNSLLGRARDTIRKRGAPYFQDFGGEE